MPTDLLQESFGIPRSLLEQITAVASSVKSGTTFMGTDGTIQTGTLSLSGNASTGNVQSGKTFYSNSWTKQTGTLALSGNAGTGDVLSGKTFYSNSWTRQTGTLTYDKLGISVKAKERIDGDYTTHTRTQAVKAGETWLFVSFINSSYTSGQTSSWTYPSATIYANIDENVVRGGDQGADARRLKIFLGKFKSAGTFSWTGYVTQGYAAKYWFSTLIATS